MVKKDIRIKLINEVLNGIKVYDSGSVWYGSLVVHVGDKAVCLGEAI